MCVCVVFAVYPASSEPSRESFVSGESLTLININVCVTALPVGSNTRV